VFFLLLMALVAITLLIPKAKAQGFTVESRMHGGISVPQRTEQPNIGKEGSVYARYGYYNLGSRTVGLLEAGLQAKIF
jgi:hypothetical protein